MLQIRATDSELSNLLCDYICLAKKGIRTKNGSSVGYLIYSTLLKTNKINSFKYLGYVCRNNHLLFVVCKYVEKVKLSTNINVKFIKERN